MNDYLEQRKRDWDNPRKRAAYLRDDPERVRLLHATAAIRKRHAAMLATYAAEKPARNRQRRRLPSIYGRGSPCGDSSTE